MDQSPDQFAEMTPGYRCPKCGAAVPALEEPLPPLIECPQCGEQFLVGNEDAEEDQAIESDEERERILREREQDLSEMHIRQVAALRRGAIRSRAWCQLAALACVAAAGQIIALAVIFLRERGWHITTLGQVLTVAGYLCAAAAILMLCPYFLRRASVLEQEIKQSRLADPARPPDFSTLSDGSQRWKNLEDLHNPEP